MSYEHITRRASVAAILAGMLLASGCNGSSSDHTDDIVAGPTPSPSVGTAVEQAQQNESGTVGKTGTLLFTGTRVDPPQTSS